jgi:hypothetical protein
VGSAYSQCITILYGILSYPDLFGVVKKGRRNALTSDSVEMKDNYKIRSSDWNFFCALCLFWVTRFGFSQAVSAIMEFKIEECLMECAEIENPMGQKPAFFMGRCPNPV